jgi:HEAT repeat protein
VVSLARHPFDRSNVLLFQALGDESWRVRKEAVNLVAAQPATPELVEGLIALLRASENAGLRNSAVESLERLGGAAVEPLCAYLDDRDHDLRKFLIDILGSIGSPSCLPLLVRALDDADPNVRVAAAENLGKIGDVSALPHLLQVLEGGDLWLKFTVLDALALIGQPVPLSSLAPLLQESLLRRAVYDCLGSLAGADAVPLLLNGLQERAKNARESAALGLMRVRCRLLPEERETLVDLPLRTLAGSAVGKGVISLLQSSDPANLEQLALLVGVMGDQRAAVPLLAVAGEERLRGACLEAFRGIGAAAIPELLAHFPGAPVPERVLVAQLLGELACGDSVQLLLASLTDESPELRAACAGSLGKLLAEGAVQPLADLLDDPSAEVRSAALEALQRFSCAEPAAIAALSAQLSGSSRPEKRKEAALLFCCLGDQDRLSLLAKDEDASVRKAAVVSLGRLRLSQSVGPLAMALYDEVPEVRLAAAQALAEDASPDALPALLVALNDPDPWVQTAALKGLAALGDPAALSGVKTLLLDAQGPVLIAALCALAAVGGAPELGPVEEALSHGDEEVVEAAIGILSGFGAGWLDRHGAALLRHRHWSVRRSLVRALAQLQGAAALPTLQEALAKEPDPLVQSEIAGLINGLS